MNFTPFPGFTTGSLPADRVHQLALAKFAQNLTTDGQHKLVGVLTAGEGGMQYLRPLNTNVFGTISGGSNQEHRIIALPIAVPEKDGTQQQQTVGTQLVDPNASQDRNSGDQIKHHLVPISMGDFPQGSATIFQIAYSQQGLDGVQFQVQPQNTAATVQTSDRTTRSTSTVVTNTSQQMIQQTIHLPGAPEGMTVVAQIPQDLIIRQEVEDSEKDVKEGITTTPVALIKRGNAKTQEHQNSADEFITSLPATWTSGSTDTGFLCRLPASMAPLSLYRFPKFLADTKKRDAAVKASSYDVDGMVDAGNTVPEQQSVQITTAGGITEMPLDVFGDQKLSIKPRTKRNYKKKLPKPKKPKPGQVNIVTALDGMTLFCCPHCNMAYSEKELLEEHLVAHKIERRFICDICGAGLKRKEHLERHKRGHSPDRPFICSVCTKGFKRKEHLNLHLVLHSGQKTEICCECGKAFYRKDHLRKHERSHLVKRVKEDPLTPPDTSLDQHQSQQCGIQSTFDFPHIQIQLGQDSHVQIHQIAVSEQSTVVLPPAVETGAIAMMHRQQPQR